MESEGRRIHGLAAQAREDGDHLKALQLSDEAMLAYQKESDILGLSELLAERSLVLRHLADDTDDKNFREIALAEMLSSVKMARKSNNLETLALPLFNLGKVQEELDEIDEAVKNYQDALDNLQTHPPQPHGDRPAMVADFKVHLATCEFKNGDKSALERAEQALKDLEAADEEKYNKDVWISGGHMRIASILKGGNPEQAREHLQKAKEIIDSNPDLKLRKAQWEKLTKSLQF